MSSVMRFDEWQDSDGNPVFNGAGGVSPGGLVAVKSAIRTTPFVSPALAGGGNVAVPDLSITHAMADSANKLIISAFFGTAATTAGNGQVGIAVNNGSGFIAVGTGAGLRVAITAGARPTASGNVVVGAIPSVTYLHAPDTTASITYTVHAMSIQNATHTLFINRTENDADNNDRTRAVSSLMIQEVAV